MPRPSVESATDLSEFFDTDEFALAASYTVTGGSAATVNGVFDEGHVAVDVGGLRAVRHHRLEPKHLTRSD